MDVDGTMSDTLIIRGAATGSTQVLVDGLDGTFVNTVVVNTQDGTAAGAFLFDGRTIGLTDYELSFRDGSDNFVLVGSPNDTAAGLGNVLFGSRELFYRGNDAVSSYVESGRGWIGTERQPGISRAIWGQAYGMGQERDFDLVEGSFNGQTRRFNIDSQQDFFGLQIGADLFGGPGAAFGVTGGYANSKLKLNASPTRFDLSSWNVGVYAKLDFGGAFVNALVKYEDMDIDIESSLNSSSIDSGADGWGGFVEAGFRFGGGGFFIEPLASIEYANLDGDDFDFGPSSVLLDSDDGLRGKAGVRFGTMIAETPTMVTAYGKLQAIHEFNGKDRVTISNLGGDFVFDNPRPDTYGRGTLGISGVMTSGVTGFIEGTVDFLNGYEGGGGRAGLSFRF